MKLRFETPGIKIERFCEENIVTSSGTGTAQSKIENSSAFSGVEKQNIKTDDWSSMIDLVL